MSLIDVVQSIPCYYDDETSPYGIACLLFTGRLVRDRFNNLNSFSQFNWIQEKESIPIPNSTPLAELIDRRANELLGQSISVQWSGGVDSTTLLLALIKNGISKEDLLVYYDNNSVQEYPKLFHWLQKQAGDSASNANSLSFSKNSEGFNWNKDSRLDLNHCSLISKVCLSKDLP